MNKFDASVPRKMFWSKDVGGTDFCPQCHSRLENESHSYLLLVREGGETQPFIIGSNYGYFCAHCPVVVLDYEGFGQLASAGNPQSHSFEFIVPGIVDLDAVPEDKSDVTLGDDDNPVPLVRFTNYSDQELAKRKRLRGDLRKLHRKRQHRRH
jgi:hypothetical protein